MYLKLNCLIVQFIPAKQLIDQSWLNRLSLIFSINEKVCKNFIFNISKLWVRTRITK